MKSERAMTVEEFERIAPLLDSPSELVNGKLRLMTASVWPLCAPKRNAGWPPGRPKCGSSMGVVKWSTCCGARPRRLSCTKTIS